MMSDEKRKKVRLGALLGAVSGAILFGVLSLVIGFNPFFVLFIPVGAAMAAGQVYMAAE